MKRWLHSNAVWPRPGVVGLFVLAYGMVAACLWLIQLAPNTGTAMDDDTGEMANIRTLMLVAAAGSYAIYRFARFHPACNPAYAAWLRLSPWSADKPLPLGPIHPVWQDAVVLGALTTLAVWHAHLAPTFVLLVFGGVYLGGLTLLLAYTRRWWSCLILGFLWPALLLPGSEGVPTMLVVAAMVGVIWHGLRASFRAFPWEFIKASRPQRSILQADMRIEISPTFRTPTNVGWPWVALSPKVQFYSVPMLVSACVSSMAGWWCFCLIAYLKAVPPVPELFLIVAMLAPLIRLGLYCGGVTTPFNLWGRIATGRIIVPGFDKIFLTPLAVMLVAIAGAIVIRHAGTWYPTAESCVLAVLIFVSCSGRPTLRGWVLTGQHRFRPPARLAANKALLRSI